MNLGIYYTYLVNGAALIFRHTISDIYIGSKYMSLTLINELIVTLID